MEARLRALNQEGLDQFEAYLMRIKSGSPEDPPFGILADDQLTDGAGLDGAPRTVDTGRLFDTRMELGEYLSGLVSSSEDLAAVCENRGTGAWLSLALFESICLRNEDGSWQLRQLNRYLPNPQDRFGYAIHRRHIVCGALAVHYLHGDKARLCLTSPAHQVSEFMEQIAAREEVLLNQSLIEVLDKLYWDEEASQPKRGQRTGGAIPDGALRRFLGPGSFYQKYSTTYDFWTMTPEQILEILPSEFDGWRNGGAGQGVVDGDGPAGGDGERREQRPREGGILDRLGLRRTRSDD